MSSHQTRQPARQSATTSIQIAVMDIVQSIRDNVVYASGYLSGRSSGFPHSLSDAYALFASKLTGLLSLPLPFLSFLAFPFFGGTSTTISVAFFYLTWTSLVLSRDQLSIEFYGTLIARLLCFLLPALGFLAFDCALPGMSKNLKARGREHSPLKLDRKVLAEIAGVATFNVLLGVLLQVALEVLSTRVFHLKSILRVTVGVDLPWNIIKDVARGFVLRGVVHYVVHRYVLHTHESPLKSWHKAWQHRVSLPFSIVAAYDHPMNYLLAQWLPAFLPAYLFRFHVFTWCLFLGLCSLEELFIFSGYTVLPSTIMLVGMAQRCDGHFASVHDGPEVGNYGRWGVLDLFCGTGCRSGDDIADDLQEEAEKHNVESRTKSAVKGAKAGLKGKTRSRSNK